MDPERKRGQEGADDDAADQDFPEHIGVESGDVVCGRKPVRQRECGSAWHNDSGQAQKGLRRTQILAACLPILASHQSPADFNLGVSFFTGLDRVNAYPRS